MSSEVRQVNHARRPRSADEKWVREIERVIHDSRGELGRRFEPLAREASELFGVIVSGKSYSHDAPEKLLKKVEEGIDIRLKTLRVAAEAGLSPEDLVGRSTVPRKRLLEKPTAPSIDVAEVDHDEEALEELYVLVRDHQTAFGDTYQEICHQASRLGALIEEGRQGSDSVLKFAMRVSDHVGVGPVNQILFDSGWHRVNGVSLVREVGHTVRDFISGAASCMNCKLCLYRLPAIPSLLRIHSPIK